LGLLWHGQTKYLHNFTTPKSSSAFAWQALRFGLFPAEDLHIGVRWYHTLDHTLHWASREDSLDSNSRTCWPQWWSATY
jgi:hypothetical protein